MTVTSVKDVGSMLNSLTTNIAAKSTAQVGSVSFQSVWNSQTGASNQQASAKTSTDEAKTAVKPGDSLKAKDSQTIKTSKQMDETDKSQEDSEDVENLEEAMEVLGTAAVELLNQIADTLGIEPEKLQETLSEMELEPVDLLDQATLSAFLLKVGGAEDSMALLTSEELYQDFNQLMGELERMLSEESGMGDMSLEELKGQIEQKLLQMSDKTADVPEEKAEPIIEVMMEKAAPTTDALDNAEVNEGQIPEVKDAAAQTKNEDADSAKEQHSGAKEHGANPFVQNLQPANPNLQNVQTSGMSTAWDVDTQDIMQQIMDYMKIQVKPDMSQLEMQLHPAHLGTLQIHVASKGGVLTANFVAQNEAVKAALESQMVQLKENFSEQGVKVEAIEVTVQTHQFEENLEQGQRQNQNADEKKSKTRRIKLDGPLTMEELSDMGEEEQLAAKMMAANGSTVDYTA